MVNESDVGWRVSPGSPQELKQKILAIRDSFEFQNKAEIARRICLKLYSKEIITSEFNRVVNLYCS